MWNTTASMANIFHHPWGLVIGFWNLYKYSWQWKTTKSSMKMKWPLPHLCVPNISWLLLIGSKVPAVRKSKWSLSFPFTRVLDNILEGDGNNCWVLIWAIMLCNSKNHYSLCKWWPGTANWLYLLTIPIKDHLESSVQFQVSRFKIDIKK